MKVDPTYLGEVQDVSGATVSVALSDSTASGLSFINGYGYRVGQVGSYVRIPLGYVDLFGIVSQAGAGAVPDRVKGNHPFGNRWLKVQLVGEGIKLGGFRRGISQFPTVGDTVCLVTELELQSIYGANAGPHLVRIGHLASTESIPAFVDIDLLVTRHSAVVGTTGCGKSTTVAGLLASLSDPADYPSARILVLDLHGEYGKALEDRAKVFRVNPDVGLPGGSLCVPYWALNFEELLSVATGPLGDRGRSVFMEAVLKAKRDALEVSPIAGVSIGSLTVDTPVPFSIHKLWFDLHCAEHATYLVDVDKTKSKEQWKPALVMEGDEPLCPGDAMSVTEPLYRAPKNDRDDADKVQLGTSSKNVRGPLAQLAARLRDTRFDFIFRPGKWTPDAEGRVQEDIDTCVSAWIGGDDPIGILDVSGIPENILDELVGALLRITYDALFWARKLPEGGRERPLLVVLEEAHLYLNSGQEGQAARTVRRIAKEGRKYGVGMMLVSQRPSEIDSTILSQCGTLFAMRLANRKDRAMIASSSTDELEGLFAMLPVLRTGEAIVAGEAVRLPLRTQIDPPPMNRRPDSVDPKVIAKIDAEGGFDGPGGWNQRRDPSNYAELVRMWRAQQPTPQQIKVEPEEGGRK